MQKEEDIHIHGKIWHNPLLQLKFRDQLAHLQVLLLYLLIQQNPLKKIPNLKGIKNAELSDARYFRSCFDYIYYCCGIHEAKEGQIS